MNTQVAIFRGGDEQYYADSCEPLKHAVAQGELQLHAWVRGAYPGVPFPKHSLPEVRTVGYWDAPHDQKWGLDWHRNEGIEITYVARGKVQFMVGDQQYLLKRGAFTITRPWQAHRVGIPNVHASQLYWLILDVGVRRPNQQWRWPRWLVLSEAVTKTLTTLLSHNEQPVWEADDEIAFYFEKLGQLVNGDIDEVAESHMVLYINGLLLALKELLERSQPKLDNSLSSSHRTVEMFLESLCENLEEPWTLDLMAKACGLARSQFSHYCKQITNMSPNEYLMRCRISAARDYLVGQEALSITEVAFRAGFGSSQYFATVFQTHYGCSPREYRSRYAMAS